MKKIDKMLSISSESISNKKITHKEFDKIDRISIEIKEELFQMLSKKNGFLAFENALLILPSNSVENIIGIFGWNKYNYWKKNYTIFREKILFFALDIFACQFGITSSNIIKFNPETGEIYAHSNTLEDWAGTILSDYNYETGWLSGKQWQEKNGPLKFGYRLLGKKPFVLGGEYLPDNLKEVELSVAMEKLGNLYNQIKNVPDGEKITIKGWI